jgi:hypothetical protein
MKSREEKVIGGEGHERAKGRGNQGRRIEAVFANFFEQTRQQGATWCFAMLSGQIYLQKSFGFCINNI